MAQVLVRNVSKHFGSLGAVNKVTLEIQDGEFFVLVGPSGSGKTTLLRMIAGLEEITEGEILIGERLVNDLPPAERDVAMVFQNYALYPHMSAYENIAYSLKLRRLSKKEIERRVQSTAQLLGIKDKLKKRPKELSGGERQRVALGRAIVREPQVFLYDEPLSNLDARLRVHMRAELQALQRRLKTTTVYVTHDQVEAMTLGHRVAVMHDGQVQQVDTPQNLYAKPANTFVATFIGSPPMNLLSGHLQEQEGKLSVVGEGFDWEIDSARVSQLHAHIGRSVLVGLRPEDLLLSDKASNHRSSLNIQIRVLERLGDMIIVYGDHGECELTAKLSPYTSVEVDQSVWLKPRIERLHFFDAINGQALG